MPPPKMFSIFICLWFVFEVLAFGLAWTRSSTRALTTTEQQPCLNRLQEKRVTIVACMPPIDWKQPRFSGATFPSFPRSKKPMTTETIILRMKDKSDACEVGASYFSSGLFPSSCNHVRLRLTRLYMTAVGSRGLNDLPDNIDKYQSKTMKKWTKTKSALLIYKQLYGNLKVPRGFVVPHDDKNWPAELWGEKLGITVGGIRNKYTFSKHRKELLEMGMKFALKRIKITWPIFRLALETYMQLYGDSRIPGDFIVPYESSDWPEELWDMELGKAVSKMRYDDKFEEHRPEMEAMGFDLDPQPPRGLLDWPQLKLALETYKRLHDDLLVRTTFIVPDYSSNWPEELWGTRLGRTVDNICKRDAYKDYREELEAMGFDFNPQRKVYGWVKTKLALEIYKKLYGDLLVPRAFVVPKDDIQWPEKLWGLKLGSTVCSIRSEISYSKYRDELEAMGFDFNPQIPKYGWDKTKPALETYKERNGDLRVPVYFLVPDNDGIWPEELWGMPLGSIVNSIRCNNNYKDHRKELVAMGFEYKKNGCWEKVKLALETHKILYGDLNVLFRFIVPENDSDWPEETWGMKLGSTVQSIRNAKSYVDYREELEAMGFDYIIHTSNMRWGKVKLALEIFKTVFGNLKVQARFVVPENSSVWPMELWGVKLGVVVSHIRNKNAYPEHREELIAMGFDYSTQSTRAHIWDKVKPALDVYKRLYGDVRVAQSFVIPQHDSQWPEELWGMKLGQTVNNIRNKNAYPEHREELEAMGFDYSHSKGVRENCK